MKCNLQSHKYSMVCGVSSIARCFGISPYISTISANDYTLSSKRTISSISSQMVALGGEVVFTGTPREMTVRKDTITASTSAGRCNIDLSLDA